VRDVTFERTAGRIWKHLTREERLVAATAFWHEPPEAMIGTALAGIIKARHLRPQVARSMSEPARAEALASVLEPGETLASSLIVALHLAARRRILAAFLDALGLPHEDGLLKEDESVTPPPLSEDKAKTAVAALVGTFDKHEVETYLNTLWLQDPERWAVLEKSGEWLGAGA
jgi:hypothetical protein